ncbi:MFS transporter [Kineococcus sp. GCM10028916]|uniref:MFS transporter n=1 Tax=Kineococcus sp. GCM10028916 TaxID=3273394 RepID=UPI003634821E
MPRLRTRGARRSSPATTPAEGFPLTALLVMAVTGFLLIATETMPAGLLPEIAAGMGVSEGLAGQYVSSYALGTVVCAVPAAALTRGVGRRRVLLVTVGVFLLANSVVAVSGDLVLTLVMRFVCGACSGLLWGMLAGYARRISSPASAGRALSIASLGTPVGLAVGTPFGSWLGASFGWRWSFLLASALALVIVVVGRFVLPDAPGGRPEAQLPLRRVLRIPGVAPILVVIPLWMLAHNTMYTYVSAYLRAVSVPLSVDRVLVLFGVCALVGLLLTGALIDRALRSLVLSSLVTFLLAGGVFLVAGGSRAAVLAAVVAWGLAFGGAAAQLQTAMAHAAGENADVANSFIGVAFNLAIAGAGVFGAVLIGGGSAGSTLPLLMVVLAGAALLVVALARRHAFPARG